jgi:two-component system CitB family sensor kinase
VKTSRARRNSRVRAARQRGGTGRRLSFSSQTLLSQLGVVALVVLISTGMFAYLSYSETGTQVEARALAVANSIAARDDIRTLVSAVSAATAVPGNAELRRGPIERAAEEVRTRTKALFVVVTDDDGIRLSHPTPSLLGKMVSTSPAAALDGKDVTAIENGTLGLSARAKVPIWSPDHRHVVGEVSVGFSMKSVLQSLGAIVIPLIGVGLGVLILAAGASAALVRRLRKLTLGLEPEEISALVQDQEVVLYGVGEGVIGTTPEGVV